MWDLTDEFRRSMRRFWNSCVELKYHNAVAQGFNYYTIKRDLPKCINYLVISSLPELQVFISMLIRLNCLRTVQHPKLALFEVGNSIVLYLFTKLNNSTDLICCKITNIDRRPCFTKHDEHYVVITSNDL